LRSSADSAIAFERVVGEAELDVLVLEELDVLPGDGVTRLP